MTKFAKSLLLAMFGLALLPVAAAAAPVKPSKTTVISAYVGPSIVYVGITWKARVYEGLNNRYMGDENGSEAGNAVVFELPGHCTGYVVNPEGYIATAGHCLDPKERLEDFKLMAAKWAVERNGATNEWYVGNPTVEEVLDVGELRVDSVIEDRRNPDRAVTASWGTEKGQGFNARVVSYQRLATTGDAGLIKVESTGLQAIKLADSSDLENGTEIVSIGYPGKVDNVVDDDYSPSYKEGQISSKQTIGEGILTVYEVSTGMSGGMSGGPAVNLTGNVVGFNSFGATEETELFNFVGPTSMVKELLADAGVKNEIGELSENYNAGLDAYFAGDKDKAVKSLQAVIDEQPRHELAFKYLGLAKKLPDPFPVALVVGIGVGVLALAGVGAALMMRRKRGGKGGPPVGGSLMPTPTDPPVAKAADAPLVTSSVVSQDVSPAPSPPPSATPTADAVPDSVGFLRSAKEFSPAGTAVHYCISCGTKSEAGARFCLNCGTPV